MADYMESSGQGHWTLDKLLDLLMNRSRKAQESVSLSRKRNCTVRTGEERVDLLCYRLFNYPIDIFILCVLKSGKVVRDLLNGKALKPVCRQSNTSSGYAQCKFRIVSG